MKDLICINSKFSQDTLEFYSHHGVKTPEQDKMYTIRNVIRNTNGEIGLHLEEIVNPHVPIKHPIMGIAKMEPNWHNSRFRNLDGTELSSDELREMIKESQKQTAKV